MTVQVERQEELTDIENSHRMIQGSLSQTSSKAQASVQHSYAIASLLEAALYLHRRKFSSLPSPPAARVQMRQAP